MSLSSLFLIKENLFLVKFLITAFFLIFGIAPLFIRGMTEAQSKPIVIEITAFVILITTIIVFVLDLTAKRPLFNENDCIALSGYYSETISEFPEINHMLKNKIKIKKIGEDHYLVTNGIVLTQLSTKSDFKYKKCN